VLQIIDKVEKENFGLKLKIHFLEEALRRKDPAYNEAALKENTDLKVDKVTMQRELYGYRKTLGIAERDLEKYRQQLAQVQENMRKRHADEGQREELDRLRRLVEDKDFEIQQLKDTIEFAATPDGDVDKLKDEMGDLEADGREKDRLLEDRDDEIEELQDKLASSAATVSNLEDEVAILKENVEELQERDPDSQDTAGRLEKMRDDLSTADQRIEELEDDLDRQSSDVEKSVSLREQALKEKEQVQADLDELREDMSNKSFNLKGLSRQLEEKAKKLRDEIETLRSEHTGLEEAHEAKLRENQHLQEKVDELIQEGDLKLQNLNDDLELASHEKDIALREQKSLQSKLRTVEDELLRKTEAKDLLQSRHDTLTTESASLQKDLARCQIRIDDLENDLENEREHAMENDRAIRGEVNDDFERLKDEFEDLRQEFDENERRFDAEEEKWSSERQNLESRCERAEQQATGLERTLEKLQEADATGSGKSRKIQEALHSEKDRHAAEEVILSRQLEDLTTEAETRRRDLEDTRTERSKLREELRASRREQLSLQDKIQGLEDEIEVLQSGMEEDGIQTSRLQSSETQCTTLRKEKQALQDQFANLNIEMHTLRNSLNEVEAQRDELKSELRVVKHQNEDTIKLDQEKLDLRTAKSRLEADIIRLREEKKSLGIKAEAVERELEEEIEKAGAEETRMEVEIDNLKKRLAVASEGRDKELRSATEKVQHLEGQIQELESQLQHAENQLDGVSELSILRKDLDAARKKETDYAQREAAQRQSIREMKRRISDLEQHSKEQDLRSRINELEASHKLLSQDLEDLRLLQDHGVAKNSASEQTIERLRKRIKWLEADLQSISTRNGDQTIALERKDLHDMLKGAKLELEDVHLQFQDGQEKMETHVLREKELRAQLKRTREERGAQTQKANLVFRELDTVQRRYERTLGKMEKMQDNFEMERKALTRGVRFPNVSSSSLHQNETALVQLEAEAAQNEKRHGAEIKGLAKQIGYLRARCQREQAFRADLAYAKKFFLMQVQLYSAW
jgi:chromosome segregation ATPase